MDIKLIRAFIASPGGLEAERRAARAVADQINRTVAREMGGRLELIGWEETLSGVGRPQAIINEDLESCDLFIGAMWTRWGTLPSTDGPYSSGFEEEFELSRARYGRTNAPTMAMFFKNVDPIQLNDPGDELKKVLKFQKKLQVEKAFLYGAFSDEAEFAEKIRDFLTAHTIRLLRKPQNISEDKPTDVREEFKTTRSSDLSESLSPDNSVEALFLSEAARELTGGNALPPAYVVRIRVIGAASGRSGNDSITLGPHDANLFYHERKTFTLSAAEKRVLLEAGLSAISHENVPLWSWLAELNQDNDDFITGLTLLGDVDVRVGALTAMRFLGKPIARADLLDREIVGGYWLDSKAPEKVRTAALRYLRDHGAPAHLPAIEKEIERADKDTLTSAQEAGLAIRLREDPQSAAVHLLSTSFEALDATLLNNAIVYLGELDSDALRQGLDHRAPLVRARVLTLLSERASLDLETIGRAMDDDALTVRLAGLLAREKLGQTLSIDEAEKILVRSRRTSTSLFAPASDIAGETMFAEYSYERLRQMPISAVEALLGSTKHRHSAFLALAARRVSNFGEQLRKDLADGFQAYCTYHWPDGIRSPPLGVASILGFGAADPLEVKRRDLVRHALNIVAAQRNKVDLPLVRSVLDRGFVGPGEATVSMLRSLGGAEDIVRLGKISRIQAFINQNSSETDLFDSAARAILTLHKGRANGLLALDLVGDMRARVIELLPVAEFATLTDSVILDLLLTKDDLVRRSAAKKVPASLPQARVRKILGGYREREDGIYYIVTHWLDLGLAYSRSVARRVVAAPK